MPPVLIVTVDTEEEGLWDGRFPTTGNTVENIAHVGRFQELCDRHRIRPTYLIDAPVVDDDRAAGILRDIHDGDRCEIGAHLHPWCNPPLSTPADARHSYLCNLEPAAQRDKLAWLTDRIEDRIGARPKSFRAGRYGLDVVGAKLLADLGYWCDSSVIPFSDLRGDGGPDFRRAPHRPYFVGEDDLFQPVSRSPLLEVPVSVGYSDPDFARADRLRERAAGVFGGKLRLAGLLDRFGVVRRIKFSPEQADLHRLKQLANAYVAQDAPALVLMFHSSSLMPGATPYVRTPRDLEEFCRRLEGIFAYCLGELKLSTQSLGEYAAAYAG